MKNVFTRLTAKTLKANRTRTTVTIIGILLATAMLTAVTTFISSLQGFMVENFIAENGDWFAEALQIPEEKLQELQQDKDVTKQVSWQELGYALTGLGKSEEPGILPYYHVVGIDDAFAEAMPVKVTEGRLPENDSEILLSESVKNAMESTGQEPVAIGSTMTLELGYRMWDGMRLDENNPLMYAGENSDTGVLTESLDIRETRTYTVVGYMENPAYTYSNVSMFCFTRKTAEPAPDSLYTSFFKIKKSGDIYDFVNDHLSDYGVTYNSELLRLQGVSTNRAFMQLIYGMSVILILLIMVGGVSLVYNSFAISVSDRTKQFGLLASVGATPRQLRGMVFREALILSSMGIPLGILSGIAGIGVTLHLTAGAFQYLYDGNVAMRVHVSLPALGIAAGTALATVLISAWIPARRAAKIPPMEAIKMSRDIRLSRREIRRTAKKGRLSQKLFGLPALIANRHFSREKRQYRATVLSLFISIVLFVSASSYSSYLKKSLFDVKSVPEYDVSVYGVRDPLLQKELENLDGVQKSLYARDCYPDFLVKPEQLSDAYLAKMGEMQTDENGYLHLYGEVLVLSDADYESWLLVFGIPVPEEKENEPVSILLGANQVRTYNSASSRYEVIEALKQDADSLRMSFTDYEAWSAAQEELGEEPVDNREDYQITVQAQIAGYVPDAPMNLLAGMTGFGVILSESQMKALVGDRADSCLPRSSVYLKATNYQQVAEEAQELIDQDKSGTYMMVDNVTESTLGMKRMLTTVDVFAYGFIALISLIAAANVFNTISTGFLLRRREFAVLSSVGMTPKEMSRMLSYECILYGTKSLLYGLPVSLLVTYGIYRVVRESVETNFYIPVTSLCIVIISVFLVVFSTMLYAKSKLRKANIIDSIRQENL